MRPGGAPRWQLRRPGSLWSWPHADGHTLYHSVTGSTHRVDNPTWAVLEAIGAGCGEVPAIHRHLQCRGQQSEPEDIATTVQALQQLGLIRRLT